MNEYMWIIWLSVFAFAVIVEFSTTELVSLFFAFGAVIALIISFIPGVEWWVELIVFVVISGVSLFGLRPLMHRFLNKEKRSTNVDEFIGKTVTILDVNGDGYPEVKVNGLIWRVTNIKEEEKLVVGDKATILKIEGNRLVVRKD